MMTSTMSMMRSILLQPAGRRWTSAAAPPLTRLFHSTTANASPAAVQKLKDSYEYIQVDHRGAELGVGVIALHRPQALNALCDALFADLIHAATALDQDDTIGCLVLTGSTPKAFAAGADISEMKDRTFDFAYQTVSHSQPANTRHSPARWESNTSSCSLLAQSLWHARYIIVSHTCSIIKYLHRLAPGQNMFKEWGNITSVSKPVIAAVNGFCLGGTYLQSYARWQR